MIVVGRGRFGPYVKYKSVYANIPKTEDPAVITLERGTELIQAKLAGVRQNIIKEFSGSPIQVLNGRYGPYIAEGKKYANVPKDKKPEDLTLEEAMALLAAAPDKKGGGKKSARRKPTRKKKA